ncbi:MAG: Holliday junction resolvase RuvX [Candidatus Dormibacteria bacterium]
MSRILAVDPGRARIGLALSDQSRTLATPLTTVAAGHGAAARVLAAGGEEVALVLVGLPRRLDGSEGPEARMARELAAELGRIGSCEVLLWDERFTSKMAEQALLEAGSARPRRRGGPPVAPRPADVAARRAATDRVAAAILLQSFLDSGKAR